MSYDAAGSLTKDKDSYEYEYDYESRIVKITKDPNDTVVAEYAYDALGRRIQKKDLIDPNNTTRYYYNNNWQVLGEYDDNDTFKGTYVYGNYIDEVLYKPMLIYYVHDHLYSPAALVSFTATVIERYEYDAYGNCYVLEPNFAPDSDGESDYGNPYLFTGRRVDILDSGSLKIQYNRNRYYDYYSGRWLTRDPLGYVDGMSLYEYVMSAPNRWLDPYGLCWWCKDKCKKGEIEYELLDKSIVPVDFAPDFSGAVTDTKAAILALDTLTVAKVAGLIAMGLAPEVIVAEILASGVEFVFTTEMVAIIDTMFGEVVAAHSDIGFESYLKVKIKKCKKERCCLFLKRYNWKKGKAKYYPCKDGSPLEFGIYDSAEDAAENFDACKDTFEEKFNESKDNPKELDELFWPNKDLELSL